jgi:hypothetical protein
MAVETIAVEMPVRPRPAIVLVPIGFVVLAVLAAPSYFPMTLAYALALLPVIGPIPWWWLVRRPVRAVGKLTGQTLTWRERGRGQSVPLSIKGSAPLGERDRAAFVVTDAAGLTFVLQLLDSEADRTALSTLHIGSHQAGTLSFPTKSGFSLGRLALRCLPLAALVVVDATVGFGWSWYLLLLPPFYVAGLVAGAVAVMGSAGRPVELRDEGVFIGNERALDYASIRRVESDGGSVTVTFLSGGEPIKRSIALAHGHAWLAPALHACLDDAARTARRAAEGSAFRT